jgi:hypothetical protein
MGEVYAAPGGGARFLHPEIDLAEPYPVQQGERIDERVAGDTRELRAAIAP